MSVTEIGFLAFFASAKRMTLDGQNYGIKIIKIC